MLVFNFANCTFAYRHLAEGLSAFSSFIQYLDKVIKADQCAQYVDDIGITANDADPLIANLRAAFKCIQEAGLKLTMDKCHFGATKIDFLGRTLAPQGVKPKTKMYRTSSKKQLREVEKRFTTLFGIPELLSKLCPKTVRTPSSILLDAQK